MGARERTGETAVLRVLGFPRQTVFRILLLEALFYGLLGAAAGLALTRVFSRFVGAALDKSQLAGMGQLLVPRVETDLLVLGMAVGLAVVAGLAPALNLSRRPIVQLLREAA